MSYQAVVDGLHVRLATVAGLSGKPMLKYEPTSIQDFPTVYTLLDSVTRRHATQLTIMRYRILHRVVFRWQDNEQAELELMPFVNAIPLAIDQDAKLGGTLSNGYAEITEIVGVFVIIGGTLYRALDCYAEVEEKASYKTGGI